MAGKTATGARAKQQFQAPGHYTDKDREKIPDEDFAGPNKSFPIVNQADVHDAATLIGHADDPDAVKAKVKAIAKRKGFDLPASWESEDEAGRVAGETTVTRSATPDGGIERVLCAPITRVDAEKRQVELTATSEAKDSFRTRFDYDASKDAFLRWVGNVREMHQPKAVGTRVGVKFDDDARKIVTTVRISRGAQDTWEKILDGTLKGASIGASNVVWETRRESDGETVPVARKYDLVELSLVDNPSNPDALGIAIVRAAQPDEAVLDAVDDAEMGAEQRLAIADAERAAFRDAAEGDLAAEEARDMAAIPHLSGAVTGSAGADAAAATLTQPAAPAPAAAAVPNPTIAQVTALPPDRAQRQMPEQLRRDRESKAEAAYIRLAGDVALAAAGLDDFDPNVGTYDAYIARVTAVRGPAEAAAMMEYRAKKKAAAAPAAAAPEAPAAGAGAGDEADTDEAQGDQGEQDDDDGERAVAQPDATRATTTGSHVTGQVQVGPMGAAGSEALDTDQHGHIHTHAHGEFSRHDAHDHTHVHLDGTTHSHPHVHAHEHGDHDVMLGQRDAGSAAATEHSHEHKHIHDHMHTFRAGQPTDARLLSADELRAPFGTPADASDNRRPPKQGSTDTGQLNVGAGGQDGVSPVLSVQPKNVGHRVLYNTEDAAALEAGVPAEAEQRPTPTGDITLNDSDFHEGGHSTSAEGPDRTTDGGADAQEFDSDGDHDGDAEDEQPPASGGLNPRPTKRQPVTRPTPGGTPSGGPSVGAGQVSGPRAAAASDAIELLFAQGLLSAEAAEQMRAASGANATNMGVVQVDADTSSEAPGEDDDSGDYADAEGNDGDADDGATPARPPRATTRPSGNGPATPNVGKNPADTGLSPYLSPERPNDAAPVGKEGGLPGGVGGTGNGGARNSAAEPSETRVGARVSAESREMLHDMRDTALEAVRKACAHCNGSGECPECADLMAVLNGGAFNAFGDHEGDDKTADTSGDTALFGNLRVMTALFQRDITRGFRDLRGQYEATVAALRDEVSDLRTQLADAQLTLADHQSGYATQVTRAVEAQMQTRMEALSEQIQGSLITRLAPTIEQAVQPLSQQVEAFAADAAGTRALVEKIADQPAIMGGPASGVAVKRFASSPSDATGNGGASELSPEDEMAVLERLAATVPVTDTGTRLTIAARQATLKAHSYSMAGPGTQAGLPGNGLPGRR